MADELKKKETPKKRAIRFAFVDDPDALSKSDSYWGTLEKSAITTVNDVRSGKTPPNRLGFIEDPTKPNHYQSLYKPKPENLLPDFVLKRIAMRDDLVAAILNTRANQILAFGYDLEDRFSTGFRIEPRKGVMDRASAEAKSKLEERIAAASKLLSTCGHTEGVDWDKKLSLPNFLAQQARNAVLFGRFATEIIYDKYEHHFHSFRPLDVGTVYQASPQTDALEAVRKRAMQLLAEANNERLRPEKFENDEYAWVQVINGFPRQAFGPEELIVRNTYGITDIELMDYPLTPIDTVIDAVTTHMNITNHNKLYFQSGRAARGMIVIKSADISQDIVEQIRQHFNASINSVQNSWRVPVFGIDPEESVEWEPLEMQGGRDMEFQFLADTNARVILSAFQMSPEEIPGYAHLSRGTNNQALSESNNEYKLEAARDVGIRPLMRQFQDFLNEEILSIIDPDVAQLCTLKLYGLDADTEEKESTRLVQDQALHMTYDALLLKVEKEPIGKAWGGEFPLNPGIQGVMDKYVPVGEIQEHFFGRQGAAKDPAMAYYRDPFWFNMQNLQLQIEQMKQAQQQAEQQAAAEQQQAAAGEGEEEGGGEEEKSGEEGEGEISTGADQLLGMMSKSEDKLPPNKRRILAQHRMTVKSIMDSWESESKQVMADVLDATKKKTKKS